MHTKLVYRDGLATNVHDHFCAGDYRDFTALKHNNNMTLCFGMSSDSRFKIKNIEINITVGNSTFKQLTLHNNTDYCILGSELDLALCKDFYVNIKTILNHQISVPEQYHFSYGENGFNSTYIIR